MTVLHPVQPRDQNTQNESVLQHFYFVAVLVVVLVLAALRIIVLRRRNQALSDFFRTGGTSGYAYGSYPPHDTNPGSLYHGIQLARPAAAYHPDRRLHAADLDPYGRRLGSGGEEMEGKDALPAYDNLDRPPKYVEAGWSHGGPLPPADQPGATSSPAGRVTAQAYVTTGVIMNNVQQPGNGHAMAGSVHGSEAPPPAPTHRDLSSS